MSRGVDLEDLDDGYTNWQLDYTGTSSASHSYWNYAVIPKHRQVCLVIQCVGGGAIAFVHYLDLAALPLGFDDLKDLVPDELVVFWHGITLLFTQLSQYRHDEGP